MRHRPIVSSLLGTVLVLTAVTTMRSQQASPRQGQLTFKGGTALVQVDVVVRDGKGTFVGDITKDDIQIFEDGKPQTIQTFTLVGAPGAGTAAGSIPAASSAAAPAGIAAPAVHAARPVFIFVFDDEHLEPGAFDKVRKAAEDFL